MPDEPYVIWSYEHGAWWGPARCGYTVQLADAGRYSRDEAERIVASANIVQLNETYLPLADADTFKQRRRYVPPAVDSDAPLDLIEQALVRMFTSMIVRDLRAELTAEADAAARPSFACPRCGAVSYNPNDVLERYCGACHVFVDDEPR
jgi:hypothetical protein